MNISKPIITKIGGTVEFAFIIDEVKHTLNLKQNRRGDSDAELINNDNGEAYTIHLGSEMIYKLMDLVDFILFNDYNDLMEVAQDSIDEELAHSIILSKKNIFNVLKSNAGY